MEALPFKMGHSGLKGRIRFEAPLVIVEFRKWSWRRFEWKTATSEISVKEIDSVEYTKNLFGACLDLQLKSRKTALEIPRLHPGRIRFRFARKYRNFALYLAGDVDLDLVRSWRDLESELR